MFHSSFWRRPAVYGSLLLCVLFVTTPVAPPALASSKASASTASVKLVPTSGNPNTWFKAYGFGWPTSEYVDVYWYNIAGPVAGGNPDNSGNFVFNIQVINYVQPGTYQLLFEAIDGLTGQKTDVYQSFTITSPPTVTLQKVWTADGNNNAKTVFAPGDVIHYIAQVTNSGNSIVTATFTFLATGPQQIFSWSGPGPVAAGTVGFYSPSTIPANAPDGTYTITITVTYYSQNSTNASQFTVTSASTPTPSPTPTSNPSSSPTVSQTPTSNPSSSSTPNPNPTGNPTPAPEPPPSPTPSSTPSSTSIPILFLRLNENYAGYATVTSTDHPTPYIDVRGSWTIPSVKNCSLFPTTPFNPQSAFWIGLGAYNPGGATAGKFIAQIGTEVDCVYGNAVYSAVDEMVPFDLFGKEKIAGPGTDKLIKVGDHISAEVHYLGGTKYELRIVDSTQGWVIREPRDGSNEPEARYSAEWIAEDPSASFLFIPFTPPLTEFGTVNFSDCSVDGLSIRTGPIIDEIKMQPSKSSNLVKAMPSGLDSSGTAFSVMWESS